MSELVRKIVSMILAALVFEKDREELMLLVNEADFHQLLSQEPKFVKITKYPTGAEIRFMGIRTKLWGNKSAPMIMKRIL